MNTATKKIAVSGLIAVALVVCVPFAAHAFTHKTGEQPVLPASEVVQDDLYMAGGSVVSAGTVAGDAFFTGGTILVSGSVGQDAAVFGGSITVLGDVGDDARIAGGTVVVQSTIKGDAVIAGGQVTLSGAGIGGDAVVAGGQITVTSPIAGDVRIAGGEVFINAPVTGNVRIDADKVHLGPDAVIGGTFTYSALAPAFLADGAVVKGETTFTEQKGRGHKGFGAPEMNKAGVVALVAGLVSLVVFAKLVMAVIGALLIGYFFRRYSHELVVRAAARPWHEIARGLVFLIMVPVVSAMLFVTVIGIPLGVVGFLTYAAAMVFMSLTVPIVTGALVHKWIWKPSEFQVNWKTILLGAVVYGILDIIPLIGWFAKFALLMVTIGAAISIKWETIKDWR